ncbi:hypothetical protein, partial [Phocaeicola coprocola]|uniref:hypothetical protein n=1 Tax=Phocaeicola coprocola TaxID=310298 RepID=UPI003AF1A37B
FSKVVYLYCVAKENNDLLLYFCACGENVGKNQANKKAKRLIVNRLAFHSVPRPGTSHRNNRKTKEFIFLIISYLHISYFLHFCPILPVFCYSVHF